MTATLTYDSDVNALYLQFTDAEVADTVELAKGVLLDVDVEGQPVGLEILQADAGLLAALPTLHDSVNLAAFLRDRAA